MAWKRAGLGDRVRVSRISLEAGRVRVRVRVRVSRIRLEADKYASY